MSILLLCDDFFFANKITGTAAVLGVPIVEVGSVAKAKSQLAERPFRLVIVDLAAAGQNIAELTAALPADNRPTVIAFASHVDVSAMQAARDAGCDDVLPRSRFSAELPQILQQYAE